MEYVYKVDVILDEEKLLADGEEPSDAYEDLCSCFYNDCFQKERSGSDFVFGTTDREKCAMMWQGISCAYKSWLKPYFKKMTWQIKNSGITEDILKEWAAGYAFKTEITLDETKVLADGMNIDEVYKTIDGCFGEEGFQKTQKGNTVAYYTTNEDNNDLFNACLVQLYFSSAKPYLRSVLWFDALLDNTPEDVLKAYAKHVL